MKRKTLDIQRAVNVIWSLTSERVGQLQGTVNDKMKELGVRHRARSARSQDGTAVNANIRSIVDWVENLTPPVDTCALDAAADEEAGRKHVHNKEAEARFKRETEWFAEDKGKLQILCATLNRRLPSEGH